MDWTVFFLSAFVGLGLPWCSRAASAPREYHYIDQPMNWADARQHCRVKYTDLATLDSIEDAKRLKRPILSTVWNWIGLTDDPESWKGIMGNDANSWRWSTTGSTSVNGYQNWRTGQPDQQNVDYACVYFDINGKWADSPCEDSMYFVCYDEDLKDQKVYTLIKNQLTWWEAQTYCRAHHLDLAMIENDEENSRMLSATSSQYVAWTGLYRVLWRWCDKTALSFRKWVPTQPNSDTNCVAENLYHQWNDLDCDSKYNFWCHGGVKVKRTMVRMKIPTKADLSNPATNAEILHQLRELEEQGFTD